jgi:hypothetical protein
MAYKIRSTTPNRQNPPLLCLTSQLEPNLLMAILLDPRTKDFSDVQDLEEREKCLTKAVAAVQKWLGDNPQAGQGAQLIRECPTKRPKRRRSQMQGIQTTRDDLTAYVEYPKWITTKNTLWNDGKSIVLSPLARLLLCIPPSSTPSEHVFSKAGYIVGDRQTRLSDKSLQRLTVIACNGHLLN